MANLGVSGSCAVHEHVYYSASVQSDISAAHKITTIIDDIVRRDTCKSFVIMYKSSVSTTFIPGLGSQLIRLSSASSNDRLLSPS